MLVCWIYKMLINLCFPTGWKYEQHWYPVFRTVPAFPGGMADGRENLHEIKKSEKGRSEDQRDQKKKDKKTQQIGI